MPPQTEAVEHALRAGQDNRAGMLEPETFTACSTFQNLFWIQRKLSQFRLGAFAVAFTAATRLNHSVRQACEAGNKRFGSPTRGRRICI
jgi:hypothetical protein